MNLYKPVLILIIFLVSFLPSPVSASTLSNQVPWGARNNYNAFDGSGWDAFFNVSFPDFGPGVDIYAGTGGTAGSGPYPSDPAAYFNGFTAGQTITFRTTITNSSGNTGKDNFWFSVSKVIACPGFNLSSPTLTEQNLYDCSVAGNRILTNQQLVFWSPSLTYHHPGCATGIDGKFCLNISNAAPDNTAALTYTWTPTEAGYYQFDFGSDDYGHDYPGATAYAAGFLRVIPAPLPPPPPPPEGTKACSITSVSAGTSSTESSISYNGWGSTTTAEPVGLWVEKKVSGANPAISPAPQVNGVEVLPTISGSTYYYRLDSPGDCNATSTISCSASKSVILPVGEYWTHCDLPTNPASNPPDTASKCSGNPFCTVNGGSINCTDFASCSAADFAELVIAPNPPEITSLEIGNNPNRDTFTTTFEGSGRQTGLEGGKGWYNPMTVKLNATKGTGDIKLYVSAFYDKRQGQTTDQQALSNLTAIEGQINADPAIGFMLAYAAQNCANQTDNCLVDNTGFGFTIGNYYAFVKGSGWVDISSEIINGYPIYDNLGQSILTVFPVSKGNYFAQWKVRYYKDFGSKKMYTPGFVIDSNNLSSFQSDIPPN